MAERRVPCVRKQSILPRPCYPAVYHHPSYPIPYYHPPGRPYQVFSYYQSPWKHGHCESPLLLLRTIGTTRVIKRKHYLYPGKIIARMKKKSEFSVGNTTTTIPIFFSIRDQIPGFFFSRHLGGTPSFCRDPAKRPSVSAETGVRFMDAGRFDGDGVGIEMIRWLGFVCKIFGTVGCEEERFKGWKLLF